jgi:hypothetical protein
MWPWKQKPNMEVEALAATPCGIDLSGYWTAFCLSPTGEILFGVRIEQYGTAVFGHMQCKFAFAAPFVIRGIVLGDRLIANYWRPDKYLMGSGMFDMVVASDTATVEGTSTWYSVGGDNPTTNQWRWQRPANLK